MDKKALKILFSCYWTSQGWRSENDRDVSPADFAYAKACGVMFDHEHVGHDAAVDRAIAAVSACNTRAVANAFVCSLSSRELDYRSALGSYAVLAHLPSHSVPLEQRQCSLCGMYELRPEGREDLNVLNFERFKWSGVRHDQIVYARLDLEQFSRLDPVVPQDNDIRLLKNLLGAIEHSPLGTSAAELESILPKELRSNKAERDVLVGILGYCGILGTITHPGYLESFVPFHHREMPDRRFVDIAYPACWWTRSDGMNRGAIKHWFGHLL